MISAIECSLTELPSSCIGMTSGDSHYDL